MLHEAEANKDAIIMNDGMSFAKVLMSKNWINPTYSTDCCWRKTLNGKILID